MRSRFGDMVPDKSFVVNEGSLLEYSKTVFSISYLIIGKHSRKVKQSSEEKTIFFRHGGPIHVLLFDGGNGGIKGQYLNYPCALVIAKKS